MGDKAYVVTRERDGSYLLHATAPDMRIIARIVPLLDRNRAVSGWRLKPLVVMQGASSRIWPDPAAAIAATRLMTPGKARAAVRDAQTATAPSTPSPSGVHSTHQGDR